MNADPKKALNDWADAVGNDSLRQLPAPPTIPDDGKVYTEALQFDADQGLRFGYLEHPVDVRTVIDNSLIEEAATRSSNPRAIAGRGRGEVDHADRSGPARALWR